MVSIDWLPEAAFQYFLIFARVGTMLMLIPALGEGMIPARMRLSFALMFSLVLFPLLRAGLPGLPGEVMGILALLFHELLIGLILGAIARVFVMSAQVAGSIIAFQIGLSVAQAADPTSEGMQGAVIGSFLSFLGITLIFATDLHHVGLAGIYESYEIFSPTAEIMVPDAAEMIIRAVAGAFTVGVQMSAPFIVFGLVFYLGAGILGRLMPQLQVFFVLMPANIGVGLILFALLLTMMMGWYLASYENALAMLRGA
ncbi:flagellar type III secretion system protein FliR [Arsenicitalea aurantiaca]|uniref:Flagellar biosynthetic protein FliR n=1 Tax=Arsenicitalea aurantiaca TaxID=1783274 RepID=A0A433XG97_9HYPH|nr:flagellar biosynthetic protein FliR [Arsenicitalea aurantiaca]RUT33113.1 flagellar type III secretion system protein FliR [Arsenicitalea aurantiaca]